MERTNNILKLVTGFLVIFHMVGVVGLHMQETRELFQDLTPLDLLITAGFLAWFHRKWSMNFGVFLFAIFWAGYIVEIIGVQTSAVFGSYTYGNTLGPKIAGVPPLMGLNWLILVYITGIISQRYSSSIWIKSTLGAILLVLMDFFIEPVAMEYDFWSWRNNTVPVQNYFAWFVIGWIMQYGFHSLHQEKSNALALPVYIIQLLFFATFIVVKLGAA